MGTVLQVKCGYVTGVKEETPTVRSGASRITREKYLIPNADTLLRSLVTCLA
jgi:hypothetical protein